MDHAIVLANGDVVLNRVNVKSISMPEGETGYIDSFVYDKKGKVRRFQYKGTWYIAIYTKTDNLPFKTYFNEIRFDEITRDHGSVKADEHASLWFRNEWFIPAPNGTPIKVQKHYINNMNTTSVQDDKICKAVYDLTYNTAVHHFDQESDIPFPANYNYANDTCLSTSDSLFKFYQFHAGRAGIDSSVLADIAFLLDKYRQTDSDFMQFLTTTGMINLWNEQNISWADQTALGRYYDYSNEDFLRYRNWLEKYYLHFKYYREQINSLSTPKKMILAVAFFDTPALEHLSVPEKIQVLRVISQGPITDWWSKWFGPGSTEELVLKIVDAMPDTTQINDFLDALQETYKDENSNDVVLFELLYEKINGDNKKRFALKIYEYWGKSKYTPYEPDGTFVDTRMAAYTYDSNAPFTLAYRSREFLGIYSNNFDFSFSKGYINAKEEVFVPNQNPYSENPGYYKTTQYGKYKIYQPVSLVDTDFESTIKMPVLGAGNNKKLNSLVPVFFIKYVDDANDWASFEAAVGLVVDVALTFSGIGNLAKLRHLRNLPRLAQLTILLGAVNVTAGIVDLMFRFATDNCDNQQSEFCKRFQKYLLCLQLVTGALDLVANYALKKSAQKLKDIESQYPADFSQEFRDIVASHATGTLTDMWAFIGQVKSSVLKRIEKFKNNFSRIHTPQELNDLVYHGVSVRMTEKEISDFLYISCRTNKPIFFQELKDQMSNWKNVIEPRGFPYKFFGKPEFETFSTRTKALMNDFHLPTDRVYVQGSSLRAVNPDDVDIAVFMTKEEADDFFSIQEQLYKQRHNIKEENARLRGFRRGFQSGIDGGKIGPDSFKNLTGKTINEVAGLPMGSNVNHIFDGLGNYTAKKFNLSIIIKDGPYDVGPYLKLP